MTHTEDLLAKLREKDEQTKALTQILESFNLSFEGMLTHFNHTLEIEGLTSSVQTMNTIDKQLSKIMSRLELIQDGQEEQFSVINEKLDQCLDSNTCYSELALEWDNALYMIADDAHNVWCYHTEKDEKSKVFESKEAIDSLMVYHNKLFVKTVNGTIIDTTNKITILKDQKDVKICKWGIAARDEQGKLWLYHKQNLTAKMISSKVKAFDLVGEHYLMYRHEDGTAYLGDLEQIVKHNQETYDFITLF